MDAQVKGTKIEAANSEKAKALQAALAQIEKQFGKGSIMKLGEGEVIEDIQVVSTGSLGLDIALGVGGLPRGRVVEIYGPESSGKTTLTLQVVAEMQKQGGTCAFIDAEHALGYPIRTKPRCESARYADLSTRHRRTSTGNCGQLGPLWRRGSDRDRLCGCAFTPKAELEGEMGDSSAWLASAFDEPSSAQAHSHY